MSETPQVERRDDTPETKAAWEAMDRAAGARPAPGERERTKARVQLEGFVARLVDEGRIARGGIIEFDLLEDIHTLAALPGAAASGCEDEASEAEVDAATKAFGDEMRRRAEFEMAVSTRECVRAALRARSAPRPGGQAAGDEREVRWIEDEVHRMYFNRMSPEWQGRPGLARLAALEDRIAASGETGHAFASLPVNLDQTGPDNTDDLRTAGLPDLADLIDDTRAALARRAAVPRAPTDRATAYRQEG